MNHERRGWSWGGGLSGRRLPGTRERRQKARDDTVRAAEKTTYVRLKAAA